MNEKLNQEIHVIICDGIVEAVLLNTNGGTPGIEVVDVNKDYDDYEELREHADKLYHDPDLKEIDFTMYHGDDGQMED